MFERCLVVDDHEMISETIAFMLHALGVREVLTAKDGAEAISKIYHLKPKLIITDLQMEPIDGLEMVKLIRSGRYNLPAQLPIIVLTANAAAEIIKECIAYDVDAFIVKPVNKQTLQNRIEKLSSHPKMKKSAQYYFSLYRQNPLKKIAYLANQDSTFDDKDINEIDDFTKQDKTQANLKKIKSSSFKDESKFLFIKWQEKYSVGNEELNRSNKNLLGIINETHGLVKDNNTNNILYEKLAHEFEKYIDEHLFLEEDLLTKYNYKFIEEHKKKHKTLKQKAEYILLKCQAEPILYKTEFLYLLKYWWVNHIIKEDSKYKEIFKR